METSDPLLSDVEAYLHQQTFQSKLKHNEWLMEQLKELRYTESDGRCVSKEFI